MWIYKKTYSSKIIYIFVFLSIIVFLFVFFLITWLYIYFYTNSMYIPVFYEETVGELQIVYNVNFSLPLKGWMNKINVWCLNAILINMSLVYIVK